MSYPRPPSSTVDWDNIGLHLKKVNGHFQCHYDITTGKWSKPEHIQDPYVKVHGLSPALNYGQQVFEGMKAYRTADNRVLVFRPKEHAKRLNYSADFVMLPPIPESLFMECIELAVSANAEFVPPHESNGLLYIRPVLFGSGGQVNLTAPTEFTFCVFAQPGQDFHGVQALPAIILEQFDRAAPNGSGSAKIGGNYAPLFKYMAQSRSQGFPLTLHLDSKTNTEVEEFSTSGFIGFRKDGDQVVLVVPDSKNAVKSITSESCVEAAESLLGWKVERRKVMYTELSDFTEVAAVGTAAALVPIRCIKHVSTDRIFQYRSGDSNTSETLCAMLGGLIQKIQHGVAKDSFGWCHEVPDRFSQYA